MTSGLGSSDGRGFGDVGRQTETSLPPPPAVGAARRGRRPPPMALSLAPEVLSVITAAEGARTGEARHIEAGVLSPGSQSSLERVTSRFFRSPETEPIKRDMGEIESVPGDRSGLGKVSAEQISLTRAVASRVFSEIGLESLRDNQELTVAGLGDTHKFTVIQTDERTFSLVSPFILGSGNFKNVYYSLSIREDGSSEQAFAFSESQKIKLYTRTAPSGDGMNDARVGADQVIGRMLQFTGSEHVAAPHYVVVNQKHEKYGGLLFPLLNGGSYENNFAGLMSAKMREDPEGASRQALQLMTDAADGLAEIHRAGLFHGDVKPANLMVNREPTGDEGAVNVKGYVADIDGLSPSDRSSVFMRTEKYLSPQGMGAAVEADYQWSKDDVWSLGMSYFEMLTQKDFYVSMGDGDSAQMSALSASAGESAGFRAKVDDRVRTYLPPDLEHREQIANLIVDMLSLNGAERPLMETVLRRLSALNT